MTQNNRKEQAMQRSLENMNQEDAMKSGWKILKPLDSEVVGKAVFESTNAINGAPLTIMKSTKRFKVEGGWMYNTSTEIHKGLEVSVAEALAFMPEIGNASR